MSISTLKTSFRLICLGFILAFTLQTIPQDYKSPIQSVSTDESKPTPYAEVKGYKYKILHGKQWKKLWSDTYARWIDPDWTLA